MASSTARKLRSKAGPSPDQETAPSRCRFCDSELRETFVDLGAMPPANNYLRPTDLARMEPFYPLHAYVCGECQLVQLEEFQSPQQLFSDYAYFSSFSKSWLDHMKRYAHSMIEKFGLDERSLVLEVASNDGYLLQYFKKRRVPVLGIEPAANIARAAKVRGIPTVEDFFGVELARHLKTDGNMADLLICNNVLAHVPDINDFVAGLKQVLKPEGVLTVEFPHLLQLMDLNQFDTIYHEHFSYLSFLTVERIFAKHGITLVDVEELPTHGGSLRIYGRHEGTESPSINVLKMRDKEKAAGLDSMETYKGFADKVKQTKRDLLKFLIGVQEDGKSIVGYGAPAKGNTLLNYCGVGTDFLEYTVDLSPHKQGLHLPGSRIPVLAPEAIFETKPDYVLILPWNLQEEIMGQMSAIRDWGGKFVIPIPEIHVVD